MTCKITEAVCKKLKQRSEFGFKKYGVTLDREDLTELQWLTHLQEELMDAAGYAEKLMQLKHGLLSMLLDAHVFAVQTVCSVPDQHPLCCRARQWLQDSEKLDLFGTAAVFAADKERQKKKTKKPNARKK